MAGRKINPRIARELTPTRSTPSATAIGCIVIAGCLILSGIMCSSCGNKTDTADKGRDSLSPVEKTYVGTWRAINPGAEFGNTNLYLLLKENKSFKIAISGKSELVGQWLGDEKYIYVAYVLPQRGIGMYPVSTDNSGNFIFTMSGTNTQVVKISDDPFILWKVGEDQYISPFHGVFADPSWN